MMVAREALDWGIFALNMAADPRRNRDYWSFVAELWFAKAADALLIEGAQ